MSERDDNLDFWRTKVSPKGYLGAPASRGRQLVEVLRAFALRNPPILEIGCNAGRNLSELWNAGYTNLSGVEISPAAVAAFKMTYPQCAATIYTAAVEDVIKSFPDGHFDVVYTMAVLQHLHPDSEWVFAEVARIARLWLVLVECELPTRPTGQGWQHYFQRDYRAIFETHGFHENYCQRGFADLQKYTLRILARNK